MQKLTLTSVTSTTPLTKTFTSSEGTIHKETAANMFAGHGNTVTVSFPEGFKQLLTESNTHQAIIHGVNQFSESYNFITASSESKKRTPHNSYARTKANFVYPDAPGLIMFDYDPSPHGIRFDGSQEFLWRLASYLDMPELLTCAYVARGSVSAGVRLKGEQQKQSHGFHVYIPVQNVSDAKRFTDVLSKLVILKGLGFVEFAKNGNILLKTIFDKSVFSPERIDFIAAPILNSDDLEYTPPEITEREGRFLDTTKLLGLSETEEAAYIHATEKLRNDAKPESKKTENTYLKKYRRKQLKAGKSRHVVKKDIAVLRSKKDTLPINYQVTAQDGSVYTIQQLLDAKQSLDGLVIADPIEGTEYGTSTAKWFYNDGTNPKINSNAHGGVIYSIEKPVPTAAPTHHVTPEQASIQLEEITTDWITSLDKNTVIKASAGTGKTRATITAINHHKINGQIHVFAPTHKLGSEWAELVERNVLQRFGRNKDNCQRIDKVNQVASKGVPIFSSMCKQGEDMCPFFEQCKYIQQYKADADVVVMPHSLLKLNHSKLEEKPAAVVIDESFYSELIGNSKKKLIKDVVDFNVLKDDNLHYKIIEAMQLDKPFFDALRDTTQLSSSEIVEQLSGVMDDINQLSKPHSTHGITPTSTDFDIKLRLSKVHRFIDEIGLLNAIIREMDSFPERKESRLVKVIAKKDTNGNVIAPDEYVILTRSNNSRLEYYKNNDIPVLLIDADADAAILNKLVHTPTFHEITVKRNARVTQYDNSQFAKNRFFPKGTENTPDLKRVNFAVDMVKKVAGNDKTLLVTYKALEDILQDSLPNNIDTLHFGAVRGVDRFKNHSKVVVIGRNQPPLYAMQNIANALWWDDESDDNRADLIMQQHRECEVLQAIDRLRFIHNNDSSREIHILNNLSLDIDVDIVENSNILKPKKADFLGEIAQELKGILPTSSTLLHKKWGEDKGFTIQQVKDAFKRGKNVYSNYYIQKCPLKNYRLKRPMKGHDLKVHYLPDLSIDEVKAKLEILHGEEIVFKSQQIQKNIIPRYVEIEGGLKGYTVMEDLQIGDCVCLMDGDKRDGGIGCITGFLSPQITKPSVQQDTILIRFTLNDGSSGLVRGYPDVDSAVIGLRLRYNDRLTDVANVAGYRDG